MDSSVKIENKVTPEIWKKEGPDTVRRVLFVSRPKEGKINPFVKEQASALTKTNAISVDHYLIRKGGMTGYYDAMKELSKVLKHQNYSLIHVHNGLSAFAVILTKLFLNADFKVVITFHGSDLNKISERYFSILASKFSNHNILVSETMRKHIKQNYSVIPCGIDLVKASTSREAEREHKNWNENDFVVLFSSGFDKKVKDPKFAHEVIRQFSKSTMKKIHFLELKGFSREELNGLMQAADVLLMCSKSEGSPQVVKEAIWNGLPVVSNNVGEVVKICMGVDHCYVVPKDVESYLTVLRRLALQPPRIQEQAKIKHSFDNQNIADRICKVYSDICSDNQKQK